MIKTGDTFESQGKTWRFLGCGNPSKENARFVWQGNEVLESKRCWIGNYLLVEEVIPEWITPTDEHALLRPECEVRDKDDEVWRKRTLVYVRPYSAHFKYITDTDGAATPWQQCRIRNPELNQ
jgi:hypothetical protein